MAFNQGLSWDDTPVDSHGRVLAMARCERTVSLTSIAAKRPRPFDRRLPCDLIHLFV